MPHGAQGGARRLPCRSMDRSSADDSRPADRLTRPRLGVSFANRPRTKALPPAACLPLPDARRMTGAAIAFMALSWGVSLGLLVWSYRRILTRKKHHDPDGIGPAQPPVPALTETSDA